MLTKLPDLAFEILDLLSTTDNLDQSEIEEILDYDKPSVKYAIRRLQENKIIQHIPDLMDMRSVSYRLPNADEYEEMIKHVNPDLVAKIDEFLNFDVAYGIHTEKTTSSV